MNKTLIDLGQIPLVNNLCKSAHEALNAERFPLRATIDEHLLVRLDTEVPSDKMFSTYFYRSGINAPYAEHCRKMWHTISHLKPVRIIDIGGNDGTLLSAFQSQSTDKLDLVNVDASLSLREDNEKKGITYINGYWGQVDVEPADLIVSTNVFQHNPDFHGFLNGIKKFLKSDGLWILEFPYFLTTAETLQFDQFYHEHVFYWLVTPLKLFLEEHGLQIVSLGEYQIHGGTLRVCISHKKHSQDDIAKPFLLREASFDFDSWAEKVKDKISKDSQMISSLSGEIVGFGAAAKGCVYLNVTNIHSKLTCVVDDTLTKQGLYIPGTALPIVNREILREKQPENLIVFAHNFKDYIIQSLRPWYKGKIITMLPEIQIE